MLPLKPAGASVKLLPTIGRDLARQRYNGGVPGGGNGSRQRPASEGHLVSGYSSSLGAMPAGSISAGATPSPLGLGMPRAAGHSAASSAGNMGFYLTGDRPPSVPIARHMLSGVDEGDRSVTAQGGESQIQSSSPSMINRTREFNAEVASAAAAATSAGQHEFVDHAGR